MRQTPGPASPATPPPSPRQVLLAAAPWVLVALAALLVLRA